MQEIVRSKNKKYVFNVNFQYSHKQVPTAYFSRMFNINKHISHLLFVLVPECGEYEIWLEKKPRRTQCTIRSAVNHLHNLFKVKTVSLKMFKFYSRSKTTTHWINIYYLALSQSEFPMNNCINVNLIYL
jgi:hypothetical protein